MDLLPDYRAALDAGSGFCYTCDVDGPARVVGRLGAFLTNLRQMTVMRTILPFSLILAFALVAQARIMRSWSYDELYAQADLVVIAKPVTTQETAEKAVLPNISPSVHVIGLSTEFDISVVMKGDKSLKKATLHHYRLADPKQLMMNGPNLASFELKQYSRFLLFLHRDADGRYSPVSGQTDPTLFSVLKLEGAAQ